MSERYFRIILGGWLLLGLFLELDYAIYALVALLLFEGITNLRIPSLISRLRQQTSTDDAVSSHASKIHFEAERTLRLIVAAFIIIPLFYLPEVLWWLPWFVGFALVGAGMSGICPMVLSLRWIGFR